MSYAVAQPGIRPRYYYLFSLLLSVASCGAFVLSAMQRYTNESYLQNYLHCGIADAGAIPIMGSMSVSFFWLMIHILVHGFFILNTWANKKPARFLIRFWFYKDEAPLAWIVRLMFYVFTLFLVYDYCAAFYRLYLFEIASFFLMTLTVLIYGQTITNLMRTTKEQPQTTD